MDIVFPTTFVEKIALFPLEGLGISVGNHLAIDVRIFLCPLFYSTGLYVCLAASTITF